MRILHTTAFALLLSTILAAQNQRSPRYLSGTEVDRLVQRQRQLGDLYLRAAASRFVVIGTVSQIAPVVERGHKPSMDEGIEGILYTVNVEQVLCRQVDFQPVTSAEKQTTVPTSIRVFSPYRPYSEEKEVLAVQQRYLLFLVVADPAQQSDWTKKLNLDPDLTYYRGQETARGIIPLPQPAADQPNALEPEVLTKTVQLCGAMRPKEVPEKISRLLSLAHSGDPDLEREANIALREITKTGPGKSQHPR